jgi:hypothetical protein
MVTDQYGADTATEHTIPHHNRPFIDFAVNSLGENGPKGRR